MKRQTPCDYVLALEFPQISVYAGQPAIGSPPPDDAEFDPDASERPTADELTGICVVRVYHRFNEPCAVSEGKPTNRSPPSLLKLGHAWLNL